MTAIPGDQGQGGKFGRPASACPDPRRISRDGESQTRAAELGYCFGSAVHDDLLVYPFYLAVQVEVALEYLLRQAPAFDRVASIPIGSASPGCGAGCFGK
jgi:hypothetical protein